MRAKPCLRKQQKRFFTFGLVAFKGDKTNSSGKDRVREDMSSVVQNIEEDDYSCGIAVRRIPH
jgi:hypothetical protein